MRSEHNCRRSNWTLVQNARYGNCYTFRPHPDKRSPLSSDSTYGLVLYLYVADFSIKKFLQMEVSSMSHRIIDKITQQSQADCVYLCSKLKLIHRINCHFEYYCNDCKMLVDIRLVHIEFIVLNTFWLLSISSILNALYAICSDLFDHMQFRKFSASI